MICQYLYNKLSYARIFIGSHLWSIGGQTIDDVIIKTFFNSLLYKTNRFQVAVRLFSNRSQRTSKCGKNISAVTHSAAPRMPLFCSYRWPLVLGSFFLSPLVVSDVVTPNFRDTILWNPVRHSYHSVTWTINVRWSRCAKWSRTWTFLTNLLWMWYLVEWNLLLAVRN